MSYQKKSSSSRKRVHYNSDFRQNNHNNLSKPLIIGYMSVDVNRQYIPNLSQLKYLNSISNGQTYLDLNHNIDVAVKRTTDENDEKIDLLLKFISHYREYINTTYKILDFITYRRTLISVICSAFGVSESLTIRACLFRGTIYLCSVENADELLRRKSLTKDEEKYCAWGYKFEQYILSDQPNLTPNIEKPVIENEEFSLFYFTTLGNLKLLYGAQIDALLAKESTTENPKSNDFETNLNYLRSNKFAELKTNKEIQNIRQERNFKRYKLLRCWCQCILADLSGLLVGFRNDQGEVQRLQWFDTQDIVMYCKNQWNPQQALNFLHYFLSYVKDSFEPYRNQTEPVALQFVMDTDKKITVDECNNDILPNWFTAKT
ncbi:decapping nuclease DXO homolog [Vanessa tameamea]|uniref:Decapping nuclease n=1 Tax=Vanessa tameamea TaxID=334116 RepID=A0ABM4B0K3_VANTA